MWIGNLDLGRVKREFASLQYLFLIRDQNRLILWGFMKHTLTSIIMKLGDITFGSIGFSSSIPLDVSFTLCTKRLEPLSSSACATPDRTWKGKTRIAGSDHVVQGPVSLEIYDFQEPQSNPRNPTTWTCNIYIEREPAIWAYELSGRFFTVGPPL